MQKENKKNNRGFTIIETMISVSLFLIIIMAGMGSILNANLLQQKSHDMRSIMDNLSFMMEDIARNMRTGYSYHCVEGLNGLAGALHEVANGTNCWGVAFEHQDGSRLITDDQWVYFIDVDGTLWKKSIQGASANPPQNYVQLTPEEVILDSDPSSVSGFTVLGAETGDGQPFVTIKLVGKIKLKNNIETPFTLQTSVSQRARDF